VSHDVPLLSTLAVSLAYAFLGGFVATRLRLPAILGYLLAGVAVGPFTPGFVADPKLAGELADIGVIMLMFGVGMHFSIRDLLAVKRIAVPGAILQIAVAAALGAALARWWGWPLGAGLVFGLALSVASTAVMLRALEPRGALASTAGRIATGWLVVEDLVTVLVLVLLPVLATTLGGNVLPATSALGPSLGFSLGGGLWATLALTLGKIAVFIAVMLVVGTRLFPWLLGQVARTGSRELFTLAVVAAALGIAYAAALLFGVSFALGAFFAGLVIRESDHSQRAAAESQPLQDAFAVLFFVSVGMLLDPAIFLSQPLKVLAVLAVIVLGKALTAFLLVRAFRYSAEAALLIAVSLAQIGEFSFILAALGISLGLLPQDGQDLIIAGAFLSITLNPLVFRLIDAAAARRRRRLPAV
jgi:monovalent cation:H+ antiporter-2, CPA2 family